VGRYALCGEIAVDVEGDFLFKTRLHMNRLVCARMACGAASLSLAICGVSSAQETPEEAKKQCLASSEAGQNQRDDGHYLAARQSFLACSRDICPKVIARSCTQWLGDLQGVAPTVVLGAKDEHGNDLSDVKVTFDGQPLATMLDGRPIETDSGEHLFHFERDGSVPADQKVVLRAGEKARILTVVLRSLDAPSTSPQTVEAPPAASAERGSSARNVTTIVLGVTAMAAAGAGAFFLVQSNQAKGDAAALRASLMNDDACWGPAPVAACQPLNDKVNAQFRDVNTAIGLLVGAGGLAIGALATWLVWPYGVRSASRTTGWIAPTSGGGSIGFQGAFE
jgi:hypothetical protein